MTTFNGTCSVPAGYYFSMKTLGVEVIPSEGGTLPGPAEARYHSVPFPVLFLLVPVIGLAFLMFLPAIGFALFGQAAVMKLTGKVAEGASDLAATVAPNLATGAAYLAGQEGKEKPATEVSPEIEKLEKELKEKRS
jgi:hypothetical protein